MEKLASAEDSQKSGFCQLVHESTTSQSQFTTHGLASVAAACQTLDPISKPEPVPSDNEVISSEEVKSSKSN